ncbi:hypothetical protein QR680_003149 [Steinernema hermaphroditum]|uniref:Uncharacterized protein n=1 Tax=Steinernema hermaphroditum TaxID=289476 RepID=A0AA39H6K6_9BILA|nr:hypothetical protein QR680_003149 [Steinernema hermaphroditum]
MASSNQENDINMDESDNQNTMWPNFNQFNAFSGIPTVFPVSTSSTVVTPHHNTAAVYVQANGIHNNESPNDTIPECLTNPFLSQAYNVGEAFNNLISRDLASAIPPVPPSLFMSTDQPLNIQADLSSSSSQSLPVEMQAHTSGIQLQRAVPAQKKKSGLTNQVASKAKPTFAVQRKRQEEEVADIMVRLANVEREEKEAKRSLSALRAAMPINEMSLLNQAETRAEGQVHKLERELGIYRLPKPLKRTYQEAAKKFCIERCSHYVTKMVEHMENAKNEMTRSLKSNTEMYALRTKAYLDVLDCREEIKRWRAMYSEVDSRSFNIDQWKQRLQRANLWDMYKETLCRAHTNDIAQSDPDNTHNHQDIYSIGSLLNGGSTVSSRIANEVARLSGDLI